MTAPSLSMRELRAAIPPHCFRSSYWLSLTTLGRDLLMMFSFSALAWSFIPSLDSQLVRVVAWLIYGFVQGLVFTGLWVLGHECGHDAFLPHRALNASVGFALHSFLLTPYFAWQSTHRRHHRFTGHMDKDATHVPLRRGEYLRALGGHVRENSHDAPLYVLARLLLQQALGWPLYLLHGVTGGAQSLAREPDDRRALEKSHFNPSGALFAPREAAGVLASDVGVACTLTLLAWFARHHGVGVALAMYGQPFLWLNQWIVAVTFLQHTHPRVARYERAAWTFVRGATATVDRDLGSVVGKWFLHNIADYHVVHHLFPRIPFYHAPEATLAIREVLGEAYHEDRRSFVPSLWATFQSCQWVAPARSSGAEPGVLRFHAGCLPPLGSAAAAKNLQMRVGERPMGS